MIKENYTKIVMKVLDVKQDRIRWVHFCYVDKNLYNRFLAEKEYSPLDLNELISRWIKEDFGVDIPMSSTKDITLLKGLLKDFYKRAHPEFYIDNVTDRQGWTRTWITRKIMEELKLYDRK